MKAAVPKTIRVLGMNIPVHEHDSDQEFGSYSLTTGRIALAKTRAQDVQACTLLHELLHVLEVELGVDLGENKVRRLSAGVFQILRDNPELVSFIMGDDYEIQKVICRDAPYGPVRVGVVGMPESSGRREDGSQPALASGE